MSKAPNYWDYIRVEDLLALQGGLGQETDLDNDEVLFITVHQVFELWFKLVLRETTSLRNFFHQKVVEDQAMSNAVRSIRRVVTLLRQCVSHFEVMETLSTRSYLGFRDKLTPASGFQSAQMRQIEILFGLEDSERIDLAPGEGYMKALRDHQGGESPAIERVLEQKKNGPSLISSVEGWLYRTPIDGSQHDDPGAEAVLERFIVAYAAAQSKELDGTLKLAMARTRQSEGKARIEARYEAERKALRDFLNPTEEEGGARRKRVRAAALFILSYRELPLLAWPRDVLDGLIELEQVFIIFRQRHARMVERVIGRRTGTGASSGVDYLDQTALTYRIFKDLWAVRTYQIPLRANPRLENAAFYGFQYDE